MKKSIYNLETIVSIKVIDKKILNYIEYRPTFQNFWGRVIPERFCERIVYETIYYTRDQILQGNVILKDTKLIIEDNKVYVAPKVVITFIGKEERILQFENYAMALKKADLLKSENLTKTLEVYE